MIISRIEENPPNHKHSKNALKAPIKTFFKTMLSALNQSQREAARHFGTPCLILAGAGSGKTRVITQKICFLINEKQLSPRHITALTFTNKAAKEMRERISKTLLQQSINLEKQKSRNNLLTHLRICTFHALGLEILRTESEKIGLKPQFSILDSADSTALLQKYLASANPQEAYRIKHQISLWKNGGINPEEALDLAENEDTLQSALAYKHYASTLLAYQAVDFDDLILLPNNLFKKNEEILEKWQNKLHYILIDEYQDTNLSQYQLLKLLALKRRAFTAVGDDDQAIYGWRGATLNNITQLTTDFSDCRVIKLEQNYRSSKLILEAANHVISNNPKLYQKQLWCEHGPGDAIAILEADTEEHEAESIILTISANRIKKQAKWDNFAILYRSNFQAYTIEKILRREGIPYVISGGQSFFEKIEIKDIYAYLRLITNYDDDSAFIRAVTTPRRGIGNQTLENLGTLAGKAKVTLFQAVHLGIARTAIPTKQLMLLNYFCDFINQMNSLIHTSSLNNLLETLLKEIDYQNYLYDIFDGRIAEKKWQNILEFIAWIKKKESSLKIRNDADHNLFTSNFDSEQKIKNNLSQIVQNIALMSILDSNKNKENALNLSTIHAAKGLEYNHVFIIGCEEDLLPHRSMDEKNQNIEEERRLMYVAITRARQSLHISWCKKRRRNGDTILSKPSRFIKEMEIDDLSSPKCLQKASPKEYLSSLKAILSSTK